MNDGVLFPGAPSAGGTATAIRPTVRLAILDESPFDAEALGRWLGRNAPDVVLVAADSDWTRLVRHPGFPADVVLLDAAPTGPVSLAARVRACRATGASVLLIASGPLGPEASGLAVSRVVERGIAPAELVAAVRAASEEQGSRRAVTPAMPPRLSAGELQALRLYAAGKTTQQVAEQMGVGYETVKTFLRRARAKYARQGRPAGRRADLVRRAAEDGILD